MINGRAAILRIVTCSIGGVVFLLLLFSFIPYASGPDARSFGYEAHVWDSYAFLLAMGLPFPFILSIAGFGALLGLLPGIAWAIDQKSARRRFLLWSILGVVIGFILATSTQRTIPMIVFPVAGVYVGSVSALNRLGVFNAKKE